MARLALDLRSTCDEARARAEALGDARDAAAIAEHRGALAVAIERHLAVAERALSKAEQRALLHDHRRLAQLFRALELAVDAGETRAAISHARRLARFLIDHAERERVHQPRS